MVARAYLDQLVRDGGLRKAWADPVYQELTRAEMQSGAVRKSTLSRLATKLEADEMDGLEGMTAGQRHRYGAALLEATARGRKDAVPAPPRRTQIAPEVSARYEALRAWRKQVAAQRAWNPM